MSRNIPALQAQTQASTAKRSASSSSLRPADIELQNELAPVTKCRRGSAWDAMHPTVAPVRSSNHTLNRPSTQHRITTTILYASRTHKAFPFETKLLMARSPYFKKLLSETPEPNEEQMSFECADEAVMALFGHYVHGIQLHGPNDFHNCGHYISLYVLASKFECEELENKGKFSHLPFDHEPTRWLKSENEVMDHVRAYYERQSMTASPFRLEYIYTYTASPNAMRRFLIATAA